ncbi:hypothetical protein [Sphingomonas sp.]|uniref:hypothetical protein n=1 Tax=Sphingomonas sp. TaxID=28214 RepID=UPI003341B45B
MTEPRRKFNPRILPLTSAVAAALLASGCGPSRSVADTDVAVCRDASGKRVEDVRCARSGGGGGGLAMAGFAWYYLGRGSTVPRVGEALAGGSSSPRAGVGYARASSATVSRGGFGSSAHASGGGGGE